MQSPLFKGRLVRLAAPLPEDTEYLVTWSQDDVYMRLLDDDPVRPQSPADFAGIGAGGDGRDYYFHLRTLDDDRLIGFAALFNIKWRNRTAEMAIGLGDPEYRGRGYGSDGLWLLLNYAFNELDLYRVGLTVMTYNTAAVRAYERAGFVHEGTLRGAVVRDGQRYDLLQYGILREEWLARQPAEQHHR